MNLLNLKNLNSERKFKFLIFSASIFINLLGLAFPIFILQVYDRIVPNISYGSLWILFFFTLMAILCELILKILRSLLLIPEESQIQYQKQTQVMSELLESNFLGVERKGVAYYLERLRHFMGHQETHSCQKMSDYADFPFLFIFAGVMAYLGGWLVIVPLGVFGMLAYGYSLNNKKVALIYEKAQQNEDRRSHYFVDMISGIDTIKALNLEKLMRRRYEKIQHQTTEINHDFHHDQMAYQSYSTLATQLNTVLIVAMGAILVIQGFMSLGSLSACVLLSTRMMQPMSKVLEKIRSEHRKKAISKLRNLENSKSRSFDTEVDLNPDLNPDINPGIDPDMHGQKSNQSCFITAGKIEFKSVSFTYEFLKDSGVQANPVFENLNFLIPAGRTVSLSGLTFSGKSTVLQLISGMLKPTAGKILIDDQKLSHFSLAHLEKSIAYLSRETYLFSGTLLDNLTLFDAKYIQKAKILSKDLGLESLILKLSQGYETPVGSTSSEVLAPGMAQMISMVRALVTKDAKIILFDEANIGLDILADVKLRDFLKRLQQSSTVVLVSHRSSMLNLADHHYELVEGAIHEEVL